MLIFRLNLKISYFSQCLLTAECRYFLHITSRKIERKTGAKLMCYETLSVCLLSGGVPLAIVTI